MSTTEITTGVDALRAMSLNRVRRQSYGVAARAAGLHADDLKEFAEGRRALPVEKLKALARELADAVYDETVDRLRPANQTPPRSLYNTALTKFIAPKTFGLGRYEDGAPQPVNAPPKPKPKRGGWLGGFF